MTSIIIVLLLLVAIVFVLIKTKKLDISKFGKLGKLSGIWESLLPKDNDKIVAELDAETEKEKAKGGKIKEVLEAKRRLLRAKAANTKIKKDIDTLTEDDLSVDFITTKSKK